MSTEQITEALKSAGLTGTDATNESARSLAINVVSSEQEVRRLAKDVAVIAARVANDASGPVWLTTQGTPLNSLADRVARLDAASVRLAERRIALATVAETITGR
jgi:hypothetical protein